MDELTRERHPYPWPWREQHARPTRLPRPVDTPADVAEINHRRKILCGTDDVTILIQVADAKAAERRLVDAIRTWRG